MPTPEYNPIAYGEWVLRRRAELALQREREIAGWQEAKRQGLVGNITLPRFPVTDLTSRRRVIAPGITR